MYEHTWHCMPFNADFKEKLIEYGRLPIDSVDEQLKILRDFDQLEELVKKDLDTRAKEIFSQNKQLQEEKKQLIEEKKQLIEENNR